MPLPPSGDLPQGSTPRLQHLQVGATREAPHSSSGGACVTMGVWSTESEMGDLRPTNLLMCGFRKSLNVSGILISHLQTGDPNPWCLWAHRVLLECPRDDGHERAL